MSLPRPAYPGVTYLISRRCSERRLFLLPTLLVLKVFAFVLAIAARRKGILVHAVCVLGNHYHAVVTDPNGDIAEFCRYLHEFTAKCLNHARGRFENMWSVTATSRVSLEDTDAILDKLVYTLLNPVSSGLVSKAHDWQGLRMWWADEPLEVQRPAFFRDKGPLPAKTSLELVPPPAFEELPDTGIALVSNRLQERGDSLRAEARRNGRRFVGKRALKRQKWSECPTTFARRMKMSPRVATKDKWRRIEALQRDKQFERDHAEARKRWLENKRDTVFPYGTVKMRLVHRVKVASPP